MSVVVAPPGYPRTKPRALNVALPLARGEFTVVYDAEDVPDPGQLRLATAHFARLPPEVACLQARLTIDNTHDSWLTRMFTIEYAALFDVFNPALRRSAVPSCSVEPPTISARAFFKASAGGTPGTSPKTPISGSGSRDWTRVADLPSSTLEEAPIGLAPWMGQRTRWMKGFIQTCIAHSRHPVRSFRQLGFWRSFGAMTVTLGTVLSALCYPFFTAFAAAILWTGQSTGAWHHAMWHFSATLFSSAFWRCMCLRWSRWLGGACGICFRGRCCCRSIISCQLGCVAGCVGTEPGSVSVEQDLSRPRANHTAITASSTPRKSPQNHIVEDRSAVTPPQDSARAYEADDCANDQRAPKSRFGRLAVPQPARELILAPVPDEMTISEN